MKLSIIIPVFNEESTILKLVNRVKSALLTLEDMVSDYELIIVDDASKDSTPEILETQLSKMENVKVYFQNVNQGKGAAITVGFSKSTGDIVLIQDADMEYDPFDYPKLLRPILSNHADVVYGSRFKGETARVLFFWHYLGNLFLTFLSNCFTNLNMTDMETCYKVFRGDLIRNMILKSKRFGIEPEMTAKIAKVKGIRIYEVPISYFGRTYEEGKKIGWRDGFSAIWCILKFNLFTSYQESFRGTREELLES